MFVQLQTYLCMQLIRDISQTQYMWLKDQADKGVGSAIWKIRFDAMESIIDTFEWRILSETIDTDIDTLEGYVGQMRMYEFSQLRECTRMLSNMWDTQIRDMVQKYLDERLLSVHSIIYDCMRALTKDLEHIKVGSRIPQ